MNTEEPKRWLMVGVLALALSGLCSVVLVIARTPQLAAFQSLFHKALVLHVDLSVLLWFFAMSAFLFTRSYTLNGSRIARWLMVSGMLLLCLSPFEPDTQAYMSNYIPVISGHVFLAGLACILLAISLLALFCLARPRASDHAYQVWAVRSIALIALMALVSFALSAQRMPPMLDGEQYYDVLFWAGGHIWQFAFNALMMAAWITLFHAIKPAAKPRPVLYTMLFMGNAMCAALGLYGVVAYLPASMEHHNFFTTHMQYVGALAPGALGLVLLAGWLKHPTDQTQRHLRAALLTSWVLFIVGGLIAMTITTQDARIPAHYHGSVIAITIALMGLVFYHFRLQGWLVALQPILYGVGKLMHITGLAVSGGYGALRKTPDATALSIEAKAALGLMGTGGLLSVIAGLLFVVLVLRARNTFLLQKN